MPESLINIKKLILLSVLATVFLFCGGSIAIAKSMPQEAFSTNCRKDADCVVSNNPQKHNHCCFGCGFVALNKNAAVFRKKWRDSNCDPASQESCVVYECAIGKPVAVSCEKEQCVLKSVHAKNKRDDIEKLRWVEKADPIIDAKQAIKKNDFRLLAVSGYTVFLPSVSAERQSEYQKKYSVRIIEGTTDGPTGKTHSRLNALATRYAEKYNRYLLKNFGQKIRRTGLFLATAKTELRRLNYEETHYSLTIDKDKARWKGIEGNFLTYNPAYKDVLSKKQFVVVCFDRILKPGEVILGGSGFILIDKNTNEVIVVVPMK